MPKPNVTQGQDGGQVTRAAVAVPTAARLVEIAREVLRIEADAVLALRARFGAESAAGAAGVEGAAAPAAATDFGTQFANAVNLLLACAGRVVVSGMGKSGHVARKIAATLASTGTPAFFVHPAEAVHGDLGMVTRDDVFVAFSNSGETDELLTIVPILKRQGARLVAITGNAGSSLAELADVHLDARVEKEACPLNLAPTASTTAALALGDALAVAVLEARGFSADDFARSHPGGALGRRLLTHVRDVMRKGDAVPRVTEDTLLTDALLEITRKGLAMTAVLDKECRLTGVFTDGDLRRLLSGTGNLAGLTMAAVMKRNPRTIGEDRLAAEAASLMEQHRINQVLVVDAAGALVGALHIHDLTNAKVI